MLLQFLKQNKLYPIIFVFNLLINVIFNAGLLNDFIISQRQVGEVLQLISGLYSYSYMFIIVMACGVIHFGVFAFYKYKEIDDRSSV